MPSSSYIRNNDYNPQVFQPFQMPYNMALQAIATKTAYWQQGARQIKAQFDATIGLDPLYAPNKEYLKNFVTQAEGELGKIIKSDLAEADNVGAALNIFKPLTDTSNPFNVGLMEDAQTHKHYKNEMSVIEKARTTNNGKDWSQDNEDFLKLGFAKYQKDAKEGNLNTIHDNYQNKRDYIPYYDTSVERAKLLKDCKSSSNEVTEGASDPLYFHTTSHEGISAEKVQSCLAFASDKYKTQIGIHSIVNYTKSSAGHQELVNDYENVFYKDALRKQPAYEARYKGALAAKNKDKAAQYKQDWDNNTAIIKNGQEEWSRITGGDGAKFINDNFDRLASKIGFIKHTKQAGDTFSYDNVKNKLTVNAAAVANMNNMARANDQQRKMIYDNGQRIASENFQREQATTKYGRDVKMLIAEGKITNPNSSPSENVKKISNVIFPEDDNKDYETELKNSINGNLSTESRSNFQDLVNYAYGKETKITNENEKEVIDYMTNYIQNYDLHKLPTEQNNTAGQFINNWRESDKKLSVAKGKYNRIDKQANEELDNIKEIGTGIKQGNNEIKLTIKEAQQIKGGATIKGLSYIATNSLLRAGAGSINTKDDNFVYTATNGNKIIQIANDFFTNNISPAVNEKRKELFKTNVLNMNGIFNLGLKGKALEENTKQMRQALQITNNSAYEVETGMGTQDGKQIIQITDKKTGIPISEDQMNEIVKGSLNTGIEVKDILQGATGKSLRSQKVILVPYNKDFTDFRLSADAQALDDFAFNNLPKANGVRTDKNGNDIIYNEYKTPNDRDIQVHMIRINGAPLYEVYYMSSKKYITNGQSYDSSETAIKFANSLPRLTQ